MCNHRQWLAERLAAPAHIATAESSAVLRQTEGGAEWRRLIVLRTVFLDEGIDERVALSEQRARYVRLCAALRLYGATPAGIDAEGANFVFGLHARSGGFCRQALCAALACLDEMPAASIGLTVGHLFVAVGMNDFQGRRLSDVARLTRLAGEGEIAVDGDFAELPTQLASRVEAYRQRAAAAESSVRIYAPESLRRLFAAPLAPETPFCGREADLDRLRLLLTTGSPVVLLGPAGVGKTRLAQELARLPAAPPTVWLFNRAETALVPWACLVDLLARLELAGLAQREAEAVQQLLEQRHVGLEQRGGLLAALTRLFIRALVIVDDAQWMDAATAQLFGELCRFSRHVWLLTRRPQPGGWLPAEAVGHELALLDDQAGRRLLASLGKTGSSVQLQNMLTRARGLLSIAEANRAATGLADALAGWCNLPGVGGEALGAAALLGQQFRRDNLVELIGTAATAAMLAAAVAEGLMFAYHHDWWGFVHPLLREECRHRLERETERRFAARAAERFLARHETTRAAELFELAGAAERAAWLDAAHAALQAEDAVAACALFEQVVRLRYPHGETGDWARLDHAKSLIVRDGYGIGEIEELCAGVAERYSGAQEAAAQELGFAAEALLYLWSGGDSVSRGLEQARRLLSLARTPEQCFAGRWAHANISFFCGDFAAARRDFEILLASELDHAGRTRYFPSDPFAFLATNHAWLLWFIGEEGWREEIEHYVASTQREPTRQAECIARVFAAAVYLVAGEPSMMARHALRALEIARSEAFAFWEAYASMMVSIVRAQQGTPPEAAVCDAIEAAVTRGYPAGVNTARWLLAEAWVTAHRWHQAHALTERTLNEAFRSEHLYCLPDLHRLHAFALAGLGEASAAQAAMAEARALAHRRGLHGWLARWAGAGFPVGTEGIC